MGEENINDNKRIAKNTVLLYFRLLFLTLISIYTVRVTLEALGVIDYGIYNVVGSIVTSLSILTGAMNSATQRYYSFHIGKKDYQGYSKVFSIVVITFLCLSICIIIIGEIVGLTLQYWINIPSDKLYATKWVFQTSLFSFVISLITIPFSSSIIANECMGVFAYYSIGEGMLRLGIVFLLLRVPEHRLIIYGCLTLLTTLISFVFNVVFCKIKFTYCRFSWKWDKSLFKEISSYTGWNLFGSISTVLITQGQNILLNLFFGPIVNAAKSIGDKVYHVIQSFAYNLYLAVSPQIIKSYAGKDYVRTLNLVLGSSRLTFMLIFLLSYPIICSIHFILLIWLGQGNVTMYMGGFAQLMLVFCLVNTLEAPISKYIQATGKIRKYQLCVGWITLSYLPVAWLSLKLGASPTATVVVLIIIMGIAQFVRVYIVHAQLELSYKRYFMEVCLPVLYVGLVAAVVYVLQGLWDTGNGIGGNVLRLMSIELFMMLVVWCFGLKKSDRSMIIRYIKVHRTKNEESRQA